MRVVYELPIAERIRIAVFNATRNERAIEKITLTDSEWRELQRHLASYMLSSGAQVRLTTLYGVKVERE